MLGLVHEPLIWVMEKQISMLLLLMFLCVLSNEVNLINGRAHTISDVNRKLKLLNKPAVKTIRTEDGDIIDCVDIYKQPAFDHPALKNHTIQMKPSFDFATEISSTEQESSSAFAYQTWQRSGRCPSGTIPIRRIRKRDLLRASSLDDFGRKKPQDPKANNQIPDQDPLDSGSNHSTAVISTYGDEYLGASAVINVWNPFVEKRGEYSTAQIWLRGGSGDTYQTIESGWMVNPELYGDSKTRIFSYWTTDSYQNTGCFDLTCNGFVQTDSEVVVGAPLVDGGDPTKQYHIVVSISWDPRTGNWWLQINNISVGYWPSKLFSYLEQSARYIEWGGEVYSPNVFKSPHTKTAMGSGKFAWDLYGQACYIRNPRSMDLNKVAKYPDWTSTFTDETGCYSTFNYGTDTANPYFYFGGPGQNPQCP